MHYGHKLNLTSGKSGMILDVVIEAGNPADAERLLPMLERHIDIYGRPPRQMAADGGYASGGNLKAAKEKGVRDMAFHKKRGHVLELRAPASRPASRAEAGLWLGALHLEGPGPLQGLRLVLGGGWRSSHASSRHSPDRRDTRPAAPGA